MCNMVAVYGTLKSIHRANRMLQGSHKVGNGVTSVKYDMVCVGFPKIKRNPEGSKVRVEVYDDPDWKVLDSYEGVPHLYNRHVITIELDDGSTTDAFIYEAEEMFSGEPVSPNASGILVWGG